MKKTLTMVLAFALIFALGIGATLAWLTATSGEVTNTFTTSDINITLAESKDLNLKMVPGHTITKDPKVTVTADSEDCWLFVKIDEENNTITGLEGKVLSYSVVTTGDKAWTQGDGTNIPANVYYQKVQSTTEWTATVLTNNTVTVNENVTKAMMNAIDKNSTQPKLTFTAYASQLYKTNGTEFTPAEAWAVLNH